MAKARQQYFADEVTLQKEKRDFAITPEIIEKLDSIEEGAQVNVIETVKVNGEALTPDEDKAVDISVPLVDDTLYSTSSEDALSARQGRILYDYIQNIQSRGRFLSNWNCVTGLATTNPADNPYTYRTGDYYLVGNVAALGGTNYKPDGNQYIINQASTTVESQTVKVGDMYIYDGTYWILLVNTEREIAIDSSLSTTSTNPVENRVITNALNGKQDTLIAGTNIQIAADGKTISATDTTYESKPAASGGTDVSLVTTGEKYTWNEKQDKLVAGNNISIAADGKTISAVDTTYASLPASQGGTDVSLVTTGEKYTWNNKQDTIIAGTNVTIGADGKTINAVDTTYTAGTNISIDANNEISAVDTTYSAGTNISIDANNEISAVDTTYPNLPATSGGTDDSLVTTGEKYTWNNKQDTIIAGANIQIAPDGKTISATDTTYVAGDFDIKDLADSTNLRTTWSGKQDELIAGTNIQIAADGKTISATDTTYTAGANVSISNNNVISATDSKAVWGSISGTLADQTDLGTALGGKQDTLIAGTNIQIASDGKTISATDTTYTAGTGIDITNGVISNTQTSAEWGNITGTLSDQTDLNTALGGKQDTLAAGSNIQIAADGYTISAIDTTYTAGANVQISSGNVISATDTTYTASDFDIKDLADSTNLRTAWSGKQDELIAGSNIQIAADGKTISAIDTTYTAGTNIQINNGVISATDTTYNTATSSTAGLVKLGNNTTQTESAQSPSSTAGRTYPVQLNSSDQMVVNVPWEDTQTGSATSTAAGTVKLFSDTTQTETAQSVSSTANRTYGIQNNSSNQMVVNVPWTDTTYGAGTYLTINGTTFDVDTTLIATKSDLANFAGFQVVATLPTSDIKTNIIYLLGPFTSTTGSDKYEEWIYSNSNWIMIGETSVDLSPYFNYTTQTSDAITEGSTNLFLTSAERTVLGNTSNTNTGDETKTTIQTKLGAASASNSGYLTSTDWSTFNAKANTSDINVKTFTITGGGSPSDVMAAIQWYLDGKTPIIAYKADAYTEAPEYFYLRDCSIVSEASLERYGLLFVSPIDKNEYPGQYRQLVINAKIRAGSIVEFDDPVITTENYYTSGTGVSISNGVISNTGVLSVNGQSGDVTISHPIAELTTSALYYDLSSASTIAAGTYKLTSSGKTLYLGRKGSSPFWVDVYVNGVSTSGNGILIWNSYTDWSYIDGKNIVRGTGAFTYNILPHSFGDMSYSDFQRGAKLGPTITLDLASTISPSANFTVNAPDTIKDGQTYILRVNNGATAYTMTLGTGITNPFGTSLALTANGVDQFVFLAIGGNLELQPEIEGGSGGVTSVNGQTGDVTVQETLTSGTNIKTINSTSLLGSGNIAVQASLSNITAAEIKTGTATTQRSVTAAALAGGLVRISSQANNILANGGKLWAGTQANYEALSSYDSNTVYLTV